MKLISKLLCLSALLFAFASCDKDYELPPLSEPTYTLPTDAKTVTIAELRHLTQTATKDNPVTITDSIWLKARISADDRSGNVYKQILLQDETGGISFLVDQSNVYTDYTAGQEVYVSLKGLCVSVYGDEQQIGHPKGYLFRTPYEAFKKHVFKNGWADGSLVQVKDFADFSKLSDAADANKFTLVRLTGVHFEDGGKVNFAEASGYGTRNLVDAKGNTIVVRTSNYADFAAKKLPVGTGNVVAVLGRFNGAWQLTIRNIDDVYGFDGIDPGTTGGGGGTHPAGTETTAFTETFAANQGLFTIEDKVTDPAVSNVWQWSDKYGMKATAYDSGNNHAVESWLVSPVIDLTGYQNAKLTFDHAGKYFGTIADEAMVMVKGTSGTWTKATIDQFPTGWDYVTATVDLSAYKGQHIQIAFAYKSTATKAGTWELKNVKVSGAK